MTAPTKPSMRYAYNADGSLQRKTDAKDQYVEYSYDTDGRVTAARRYFPGGGEELPSRSGFTYRVMVVMTLNSELEVKRGGRTIRRDLAKRGPDKRAGGSPVSHSGPPL